MTTVHSQRQHCRHAVRTDCVVTARGGRLVGGATLDLSYEGAFVRAVEPTVPGELVDVSVRLPDSQLWLTGEGYVSRVVRGLRREDEGPGLGLRIARMDGMSRVLLGTVVRAYPKAAAHRGGTRDYARLVRRIAEGGA